MCFSLFFFPPFKYPRRIVRGWNQISMREVLVWIVQREVTRTFVQCCTRPTSLPLLYSPPPSTLNPPSHPVLRRVSRGMKEADGGGRKRGEKSERRFSYFQCFNFSRYLSALLSANYLSFSVVRCSPFSTLGCRSFVDSFRETRCTADEGLSIVVTWRSDR